MRLLIIANNFPSPERPNDGIFVLNQLQELRLHGLEISVLRVVPVGLPILRSWRRFRRIPERYEIGGFQAHSLRAIQLPRHIASEYLRAQVLPRITREVAEMKPDIIHAHGLLPAAHLAVGHNVPVVVTAHGSDAYDLPWRRAGLTRAAGWALGHADALIAVSNFVRLQLVRLGANNVEVVLNGADDKLFCSGTQDQARIELGEDVKKPTIVFVGHLMVEKGIYDLIEAVRELADIRPRLLLVGDGPEASRVRVRLNENGIDHRSFGVMPHKALPVIYQSGDVVCLPSHREGLPAVLCEAMLTGRTIVASNVGGIPEIVKDNVTGFTVPPKQPHTLSLALRKVLCDPELRHTIGAAAHTFATTHLTWKVNAARYLEIYDGLTAAGIGTVGSSG